MEHQVTPNLFNGPVSILVVGAGGNGSQMLSALCRLHETLIALGHPGGLRVTVMDDDVVSEANCGRQLFSRADIGLPKATVLTHRNNLYFGLDWEASVGKFCENTKLTHMPSIIISCTDSRKSRRAIHAWGERSNSFRPFYWLDLGNSEHTGQVILGEVRKNERGYNRLPVVTELFPEILDPTLDEEDTGPSCSLAEAIEKQSLFINQTVVSFAADLLFRMFRYAKIDNHGSFINLKSGVVTPLPVDPEVWKRMRPKKRRAGKVAA